jgi:hypothetical protein
MHRIMPILVNKYVVNELFYLLYSKEDLWITNNTWIVCDETIKPLFSTFIYFFVKYEYSPDSVELSDGIF